MSEETEVQKLQWVKGDKQGNVEIVKEQDGEWTTFQSGGRISNSLLKEFMILIQNDNEILDFEEVNAPPPTVKELGNPLGKKSSPILTLLEKMEDFDELELNLKLNIKIPKREVMSLLSSTFGEDDFDADLKTFVEEQARSKDLKGILSNELELLLNNLK